MYGTSISKSHPMSLPSCPGAGVAGGEGPGRWEGAASPCGRHLLPRGRLPSSREWATISFASFLIYLMSKKINQADSHPGGFEP